MVEALPDLAGVAGVYVAIGFLVLVTYVIEKAVAPLDVGILGVHPFAGIASFIRNNIVAGLNDAIHDLEGVGKDLLSKLLDDTAVVLGVFILLALGVKAVLEYFWLHILGPYVNSYVKPIRTLVHEAISLARSAPQTVDNLRHELKHWIVGYVDPRVSNIYDHFTTRIDNLSAVTQTAIAASETKVINEITSAVDAATGAGTTALSALQAAEEHVIATAEVAGDTAIAELGQLTGGASIPVIAGLLASIPATRALVNAIATEAGLEDPACRQKVGGICSTDPSGWLNLLAGLAALTTLESLPELVKEARKGIPLVMPAIQAVASVGNIGAPQGGA